MPTLGKLRYRRLPDKEIGGGETTNQIYMFWVFNVVERWRQVVARASIVLVDMDIKEKLSYRTD